MKHLSGLFKVIPITCLTLSFQVHAQSNVECSISSSKFWNEGSKLNITVSNTSEDLLRDWSVELTYPDDSVITKHWKAERTGDNPALFTKIPRYTPIKAGDDFTFGLNASHALGARTLPTITACFTGQRPDLDTDADGVIDANDICPATQLAQPVDTQGCSEAQKDDDGDGFNNAIDAFPDNFDEWVDTDGDGIGNNADPDDDNDGLSDAEEAFFGSLRLNSDSDGDGFNDSDEIASNTSPTDANDFPLTSTITFDGTEANEIVSLGDIFDGLEHQIIGSSWNISGISPLNTGQALVLAGAQTPEQSEISFTFDSAGGRFALDFALQETEAFSIFELFVNGVSLASQTAFIGLGLPNDTDPVELFLEPGTHTVSIILNTLFGVTNEQILFIDNITLPIAFDDDVDNDGIPNSLDACLRTPEGDPVEADGCNNFNRDNDNDNIINGLDICPNTPTNEFAEPNGCSFQQEDNDNDGVLNRDDVFPFDATESIDSDGDGTGNNADLDDDNDTLPDTEEQFLGTDPLSADTDGDGFNDSIEVANGSSPLDASDLPIFASTLFDFNGSTSLQQALAGVIFEDNESWVTTQNGFEGEGTALTINRPEPDPFSLLEITFDTAGGEVAFDIQASNSPNIIFANVTLNGALLFDSLNGDFSKSRISEFVTPGTQTLTFQVLQTPPWRWY